MDAAARAKQFMPFDALKGFQEALEETACPPDFRRELSEDELQLLDRKIRRIKKGDWISVTCYSGHAYVEIKGTVTQLDAADKMLKVADTEIFLGDIIKIGTDFADI